MNKSLIQGLVLGGVAATAIGAVAGYKAVENHSSYAQVLAVEPLSKAVRVPRETCRDELVTHRAPTKDPNQVTGTVVGALLGGVVGHQIGGGSGKSIATVAGAAAGGYAGNKIQERMQEGNTYQSTEHRCSTAYDTVQKPDGYKVRYKLGDREATVRMDHDPGDRIPVKDGQLVLTASGPAHKDASGNT